MSDVISAEHFKLTQALRSHVMKSVERIKSLLPPSTVIRVFLLEDARRSFTARFKVILGRKELVASGRGYDLYTVVNVARELMVRRVTERIQKKVRLRKKEVELLPEAA